MSEADQYTVIVTQIGGRFGAWKYEIHRDGGRFPRACGIQALGRDTSRRLPVTPPARTFCSVWHKSSARRDFMSLTDQQRAALRMLAAGHEDVGFGVGSTSWPWSWPNRCLMASHEADAKPNQSSKLLETAAKRKLRPNFAGPRE
jgi:hypothetical protein